MQGVELTCLSSISLGLSAIVRSYIRFIANLLSAKKRPSRRDATKALNEVIPVAQPVGPRLYFLHFGDVYKSSSSNAQSASRPHSIATQESTEPRRTETPASSLSGPRRPVPVRDQYYRPIG